MDFQRGLRGRDNDHEHSQNAHQVIHTGQQANDLGSNDPPKSLGAQICTGTASVGTVLNRRPCREWPFDL
jgi:hypothetical protein